MAGLFWLLAKTNGTKEAEVLLFLAYNNSEPDDLDGLKCRQKLKLLDPKQAPQVSRHLYCKEVYKF